MNAEEEVIVYLNGVSSLLISFSAAVSVHCSILCGGGILCAGKAQANRVHEKKAKSHKKKFFSSISNNKENVNSDRSCCCLIFNIFIGSTIIAPFSVFLLLQKYKKRKKLTGKLSVKTMIIKINIVSK